MSNYLADWTKAKKDFAATAVGELQKGGAAIPAEIRQGVVTLLKTETGLTPALKEVDAAFGKKYRKAVMQGLTKVHAVIEKTIMAVQAVSQKARSAAMDATDHAAQGALDEIHMAGVVFNRTIGGFETRIAKELESLQEEKSADGATKIDIISIEGDVNGALAKFKSATKPFAILEKQYKLLPAIEPAVKAMQAYSKAAARTEVKAAITALDGFIAGVTKFDDHRKKMAATDKPNSTYFKAADSLATALRAVVAQRATVSMKNLKQLEANGVA